ncbi:MAG: hypothetical protein RIA63_14560 [Cyclobacteriaceae bacterium]
MTKWIDFIASHRLRSFLISFLALIFTGLLMRPSSSCLITPNTPIAIVDLELAFNQRRAESVKEIWETSLCENSLSLAENGVGAAVMNIILDFLFIAGYTGFFLVLIVLTARKNIQTISGLTMGLCVGALLIGVLDVAENIFMLIFLKVFPVTSYLFAIPASVKFILILSLIFGVVIRIAVRTIASIKG